MPSLEIVCLANSRKMSGRCIAGMTKQGEWVRPVGDGDGTLFRDDYVLDSGAEAAVLDVMRVRVGKHTPEPHQPENWHVTGARWERVGRLTGLEANAFLTESAVEGPELLGSRGDRISWDELLQRPIQSSLAVVAPDELRWRITTNRRGNRQTRALFILGDAAYSLSVTDPVWEDRLKHLSHGIHPAAAAGLTSQDAVFLTVSLSEPLEGTCYKLIAGVIVV